MFYGSISTNKLFSSLFPTELGVFLYFNKYNIFNYSLLFSSLCVSDSEWVCGSSCSRVHHQLLLDHFSLTRTHARTHTHTHTHTHVNMQALLDNTLFLCNKRTNNTQTSPHTVMYNTQGKKEAC